MSFFKKLFGNQPEMNGGQINLTSEEFFNTDYIKELIGKYKRTATLLRPHKSEVSIGQNESKFGGVPNFAEFENYPCCDKCKTPLNFVLQLYKKDFPTFYFPGNSNLFLLFRCPNNDCPDAYSEQFDHKMFHYYFSVTDSANKRLTKPTHNLTDAETEVPDCYLKPKVVDDFPNYDDFEGNDFVVIEEKFGNDLSELFMENCSAIRNSKFGGYPSYIQSPSYPTCTCGKIKEFFFQLSSEDIEDGIKHPPPSDKWNSHGIMIGDVGNIYFYVCKSCGQKTIESNWDCY
ncbi:hypothetical protein WSM22_30520 [Cytophagales bacterium WSM2-2]|nr:hypothetical protein WSM22_30520 [Cytophagales bacterium WSM2-2]